MLRFVICYRADGVGVNLSNREDVKFARSPKGDWKWHEFSVNRPDWSVEIYAIVNEITLLCDYNITKYGEGDFYPHEFIWSHSKFLVHAPPLAKPNN